MSCQISLFLSIISWMLLILYIANARQIIIGGQDDVAPASSTSSPCPLNFTSVTNLIRNSNVISPSNDVATNCQQITQILRFTLSEFLHKTNSFHPPLNSAESCWNSFDSVLDSFLSSFKSRPTCNFTTLSISESSCMNVSTRSEFEHLVSRRSLNDAVSKCHRSIVDSSPCATCLTSLAALQSSFVNDDHSPSCHAGSISDWAHLPLMYAAAFISPLGPTDPDTATCLFSLPISTSAIPRHHHHHHRALLVSLVVVFGFIGFGSGFGGYVYYYMVFSRVRLRQSQRELSSGDHFLRKLTYEEIKTATNNFHRDNLIGRGGYGNVYKGILVNGEEVAIKRFKNCSAAGDAGFTHEVEVIASICHVNLVQLKGYSVTKSATMRLEGHQRMIVCDLMKNGSLYDHLFNVNSSSTSRLSWPIRQNIAVGMARGLAYLHYGAQQAIIHRDIKASNIMLDENFEAKVGDFGLAKFNPEGFTHFSTQVAGTIGYVAPEYAIYGQVTERSDVYSFGVVLLELLSGKKAVLWMNEETPMLVTDWAWSLVREGRALGVVEEGMPQKGSDQVMEKYVLVAVLCSHPQLYARPTMDQVVKILETDLPVPSIPERPISLLSELADIESSVSSSVSRYMSTSGGFQAHTVGNFDSSSHNGQEEAENVNQWMR